jgi:16S rRNA (cytidine1402-2'-O)-methyltransferase
MSKLFIVATPIGNLGDITLRALETLKNVDLILCEDTRETKKILNKYAINTPTLSYHSQSKLNKIEKIFELLEEGKNLALVSDAGTPGISDPGAMLIAQIRARTTLTQVEVIPIPGPTAVIAALSASGLPTHEFTFLGFLPHKKGRETLFKKIAEAKRTIVFYESPHRILKTLESLAKFCPDKKVCIARELTKIYEEFKTGSPKEILEYLVSNPVHQKGEFTVIVT